MRGYLKLPMLNGSEYRVYAGPYMQAPDSMLGVKMAAEIKKACDVDIPIADFSVPDPSVMTEGLIQTVKFILSGRKVYVGCMGGIGRTGLMLAILAKAWGVSDPVPYVRVGYYRHAVETSEQMSFVGTFEIPAMVKWMIRWARIKNFMFMDRVLTN